MWAKRQLSPLSQLTGMCHGVCSARQSKTTSFWDSQSPPSLWSTHTSSYLATRRRLKACRTMHWYGGKRLTRCITRVLGSRYQLILNPPHLSFTSLFAIFFKRRPAVVGYRDYISVSVCLPVHGLPVCLPASVCLSLSVCLFVCLPVCLPACQGRITSFLRGGFQISSQGRIMVLVQCGFRRKS